MEERIIDNEREIRLKRKREGTDVEDALTEGTDGEEIPEEELVLDIPENTELPEDLVGLTPSQLKEELARREKAVREAKEQSAKLTEEGEEKLASGDYAAAEPLFARAAFLDVENVQASKDLWIARTKNFTDDEAFYNNSNAEELAGAEEEIRAFVLEQSETRLKAQREEYRGEAVPLKAKVEAKQAERREPFQANRKYYLVRTALCALACVLFAIGAASASGFIYSSLQSVLPVVFTAVLGGLAFISLVIGVLFLRKLVVASRLCRDNENLLSTEDGARLAYLQERLRCLDVIFGKSAE